MNNAIWFADVTVTDPVSGYDVEVYAVREDAEGKPYTDPRDYARPDKIAEDLCSGFLGYTYAMESAIEAANDLLEDDSKGDQSQ